MFWTPWRRPCRLSSSGEPIRRSSWTAFDHRQRSILQHVPWRHDAAALTIVSCRPWRSGDSLGTAQQWRLGTPPTRTHARTASSLYEALLRGRWKCTTEICLHTPVMGNQLKCLSWTTTKFQLQILTKLLLSNYYTEIVELKYLVKLLSSYFFFIPVWEFYY